MQFTKTNITDAALPAGKDDHIEWDPTFPGFGLRLRGDTKRWIVQYRFARQSRRESLGDPRKVSLDDARKAARQRFARLELGADPAADKAKARAEAEATKLTLAAVSKRYLEARKPVVRRLTHISNSRNFELHWKPLHKRPIGGIKRADVAARLQELARDNGRVAAARARASLSALYTWAMKERLCEANPVSATNNPAEGVKPRERVLSDSELRIIWNACQDDEFGRIVRLLMLTGARREEIGGLRWSEIDLDTRVLTLPGERTKNHSELRLTLPPAALALLPPRREGKDHVFGQLGFTAWSYSTMALNNRITVAQGKSLAPWRLHDLRRTMRTGLSRLGVAPHVAELVLNHVKTGMAAVYDKHKHAGEIGTALALWAQHVESTIEGHENNVIALRA
jgi:integrase